MKFRSKKLLDSARDIPDCTGCGAPNHGQVVMAHSNWSEHGKGMGTKAHDWAVAALCDECHKQVDSGPWSKKEKREYWGRAHTRTLTWLFATGRLTAP